MLIERFHLFPSFSNWITTPANREPICQEDYAYDYEWVTKKENTRRAIKNIEKGPREKMWTVEGRYTSVITNND